MALRSEPLVQEALGNAEETWRWEGAVVLPLSYFASNCQWKWTTPAL